MSSPCGDAIRKIGRLIPRRGDRQHEKGAPMMELEHQVAIVTGAGRGIGRATALELARLGATIVIAELDPSTATRTATEVCCLGREACVVPTDVTSQAALAHMDPSPEAQVVPARLHVRNGGRTGVSDRHFLANHDVSGEGS